MQPRTGAMSSQVKMHAPTVIMSKPRPLLASNIWAALDHAVMTMPLATMMIVMMLRSQNGDLLARQWYADIVHEHDELERHAQKHDLCSTYGVCLSNVP